MKDCGIVWVDGRVDVFKVPSFALVNSASQSNATGFENVENNMFVIFCLPKRSHNPSPLVPISS